MTSMLYLHCMLVVHTCLDQTYTDKNTRVAMVACTPQPVRSRGSNSFDKDSLRTIGLPWQPYTLGYMDIHVLWLA